MKLEMGLLDSPSAVAQLLSAWPVSTLRKPGRPILQAWLATPEGALPTPPKATRAGHAQPLPLPTHFDPEPFLASIEDLLRAGAPFAGRRKPHDSQRRRDPWFAPTALPNLLPNIPATRQPAQPSPVVPVAAPAPAPQQTIAGNAARASDQAGLTPEHLLASTEEISSLLAHWADCRDPHSSQQRRAHRLANASNPLPTISTVGQLPPPPPVVAPDALAPAPRRTPPSKATVTSARRHPVEVRDGISRIQQRQHCQCGLCMWCLDNARWNRIFDEKFADPTYYEGVVVRHNSTLADVR
jgi:hypothetical protein